MTGLDVLECACDDSWILVGCIFYREIDSRATVARACGGAKPCNRADRQTPGSKKSRSPNCSSGTPISIRYLEVPEHK